MSLSVSMMIIPFVLSNCATWNYIVSKVTNYIEETKVCCEMTVMMSHLFSVLRNLLWLSVLCLLWSLWLVSVSLIVCYYACVCYRYSFVNWSANVYLYPSVFSWSCLFLSVLCWFAVVVIRFRRLCSPVLLGVF